MNEQNTHSNHNRCSSTGIECVSFNSFERNPQIDVICVEPVHTFITVEEEIVLTRKVSLVAEIDIRLTCPTNHFQMIAFRQSEPKNWRDADNEEISALLNQSMN